MTKVAYKMGERNRHASALIIIVFSLLLTGCYAEIRPATEVTATSARLVAVGRSACNQGGVAKFEYSLSRSELAAGRGTVAQTYNFGITARACEQNAPNYEFGPRISGLIPGATYYYRVCGRDLSATVMSCSATARFTTVLEHPELAQAVATEFNRPDVPLYDVFMPPPGTPVRGVVLTIHGGAWFMVGQKYMNDMHERIERWNGRGYIAVNVDYRIGANSVHDVLDFYDAVRRWKGSEMEVGATGTSAGGHLALMVAQERPDLDWVVSEAGPTDLTRLDDGTANSKTLQDIANRYWDAQGRIDNSPALSAEPINARILLTGASNDEMVTPRQMQFMAQRFPHAQTVVLEPGNTPYVHAWVSPASLQQVILAEDRIAAGQ